MFDDSAFNERKRQNQWYGWCYYKKRKLGHRWYIDLAIAMRTHNEKANICQLMRRALEEIKSDTLVFNLQNCARRHFCCCCSSKTAVILSSISSLDHVLILSLSYTAPAMLFRDMFLLCGLCLSCFWNFDDDFLCFPQIHKKVSFASLDSDDFLNEIYNASLI